MADRYENIIRGPPVDRKPDRTILDAALEAELQNSEPLSYYDPAIFTTAVAEATVGANLIRELFDRNIAQKINSPTPGSDPQVMHICDPAHYKSAIQDATLNGQVHQGFFNKFVAARTIYQVVRTEYPLAIRQSTERRGSFPSYVQRSGAQNHHDSQIRTSQTPYTPAPHENEIKIEPFSRPQSVESHESSRPFHLHINHADPDRLPTSHTKSPSVATTSTVVQSPVLSRVERLQQKNQSSVCVECWGRGLQCDSQAFCYECARNRRSCTYVRCPLQDCPRTIVCPAYHPDWR